MDEQHLHGQIVIVTQSSFTNLYELTKIHNSVVELGAIQCTPN